MHPDFQQYGMTVCTHLMNGEHKMTPMSFSSNDLTTVVDASFKPLGVSGESKWLLH
jgi:hypothetical protein